MQLPRGTPRSVGVDAAAVEGFLDAVAGDGIEMHSLMLLRHGQVFAEAHWAPYEREQVNLLYSLSKSFVSVATGIALGEQRFRLHDTIVDLLPELFPDDIDDRWRRVTLRDCLRMATGHFDDPWFDPSAADPMRDFLASAPDGEPGSVFTYNQMATYTVARLLTEHTEQSVIDYLRPRLLDPLGIRDAVWMRDRGGREFGFSGLHVSTDGIARLGQLLLQRGVWNGHRLVPAEWVDAATSLQMPNDGAHRRPGAEEPTPDWGRGYGYQFWMSRHGFRGDGAYGQFCLVLPDQDAVLAMTAETDRMQDVLDAVWEHVLPGMSVGGSAAGDARLAERLAQVAVPMPRNDESGRGTEELRRRGGDAAPSVETVRIEPTAGGWTAHLGVGEESFRLPVGDGTWAAGAWLEDPAIPFRCAGGWTDGRFHAQLRMIRTPHTIELLADPTAGTAALSWRFPPLHGPEPAGHRITEV